MKRGRTSSDDAADALVDLLANDRDSADDVKADLVALGVDVAASRDSYKAFLKTLERQAALEQMQDATRRSAARSAAREERRRQIAEQGLSMAELQRRIGALGGKRAARGHETDTRDDLESHLADLMDSEEE